MGEVVREALARPASYPNSGRARRRRPSKSRARRGDLLRERALLRRSSACCRRRRGDLEGGGSLRFRSGRPSGPRSCALERRRPRCARAPARPRRLLGRARPREVGQLARARLGQRVHARVARPARLGCGGGASKRPPPLSASNEPKSKRPGPERATAATYLGRRRVLRGPRGARTRRLGAPARAGQSSGTAVSVSASALDGPARRRGPAPWARAARGARPARATGAGATTTSAGRRSARPASSGARAACDSCGGSSSNEYRPRARGARAGTGDGVSRPTVVFGGGGPRARAPGSGSVAWSS